MNFVLSLFNLQRNTQFQMRQQKKQPSKITSEKSNLTEITGCSIPFQFQIVLKYKNSKMGRNPSALGERGLHEILFY